jgi:GTP-binding protein
VGIVGFPNAGKSTLISAISAAHPKIAPYPFTTLEPHLGVVSGPDLTTFVAADLPGLIEGAHRGAGLGHRFLKHIQRTRVIVHVVDLATARPDGAAGDWKAIQAELEAYDPELVSRPQVVAANKIDLPGSREALAPLRRLLRRKRIPVHAVSALTGEGIGELVDALSATLAAGRKEET